MIAEIKRILIVRNDSTTNWAESDYILKKGEIGVGYLLVDGEERPIVKLGDGIHVWKDLAQSEYIFEEDFVINYDVGNYKTDRGFINTNSFGKSLSEWIKGAFIDIKEPVVTLPSIETVLTTNLEEIAEIGSEVTQINYNVTYKDGQYSYGSKQKRDESADTTLASCTVYYRGEEIQGTEGTLETSVTVNNINEPINVGPVRVLCLHTESPNTPINSNGEELPEKTIQSGSVEETYDYFINGYREGCFYGGVGEEINFENISVANLNSVVRNELNKTNENYKPGVLPCKIDIGTKTIIIAVEEGRKILSIQNKTVGAEMLANFTKVVKQIGGADSTEYSIGGFDANYDIYYYKPAHAYARSAELEIILGE